MNRLKMMVLLSLSMAGAASAQDAGTGGPSTCEFPNVMIVVDRSGSMGDAISDSTSVTKFDTAKDTINSVVGLKPDDWYMAPDQLRALQDAGHALGGHGFNHVPYDTLSPKALAADMHRAVRTMNTLFGTLPRTLAYPFGRCTPTSAKRAMLRTQRPLGLS